MRRLRERRRTGEAPAVGKIVRLERNCWKVSEVRRAGLLVDARNYYGTFHRAARRARRSILLTGWKFNPHIRLLRGKDLGPRDGEERLVPFLDQLCRANPELRIYLLAWEASVIYASDRETIQDWAADAAIDPRFQIRLDSTHAIGASHHQKFAVIDGVLAFVGGLDICNGRWDDRDHLPEHPGRVDDEGEPHGPFHDVQTCLVGPVAGVIAEHFQRRWHLACGERLDLPPPAPAWDAPVDARLPVNAKTLAVSRTHAAILGEAHPSIREIRQLYVDAILAARKLIYIENQFLTSQAVYRAFEERLAAKRRGRLQIVIVLPKRPETLMEEIALGAGQAKAVRSLKELAHRHGHSIGIYYTAGTSRSGGETPTYIHSKLAIIDDRFLSVGSANLSNRSMSLDTELNVSWEAASWIQRGLVRSIRKIRASLLAEHTGAKGRWEMRRLARVKGLVRLLESMAGRDGCRLRRLDPETVLDEDPITFGEAAKMNPFDPDGTFIEDDLSDLAFDVDITETLLFRGIEIVKRFLPGLGK